jgi:ArsR family transcriptional regulator, virulence genes transcriptional regulator
MTDEASVLPGSMQAASLLRAMGHSGRLEILCLLQESEMTMGDIARRLAMRGPAVSQQLAVLRGERLIKGRRNGKTIIYSVADEVTRAIIDVLKQRFCPRTP